MSMSCGVDGSFPRAHFDSLTKEEPSLGDVSRLSIPIEFSLNLGTVFPLTRYFIGLFITEDSQCSSCTVGLVTGGGFLFGVSSEEPSPTWNGWLPSACIQLGVFSHPLRIGILG